MSAIGSDRYNLLDPTFLEERYGLYRIMRGEAPIHWSEMLQAWVITGYDDISAGLRDPRLSVRRGNTYMGMLSEKEQQELAPLHQFYTRWLMFMDPPDHTRLRSAISPFFAPQTVAHLAGSIHKVAETLFDRIAASETVDIMNEVAHPLAVAVMMQLLGLNLSDSEQVIAWSDDIIQFLGTGRPVPERGRQALQSLNAFFDYFSAIISLRRKQQADDLISQLLHNMASKRRLSDEEVVALCANVLIDGHDPVANAIGNGLLALTRNPDQLVALYEDPARIELAVEEMLRYDCPFQYAARRAQENLTIGGVNMSQGQRVLLMLGSANRDPGYFTAPDDFLVTGRANRHLAFGLGPHYCIGAVLARQTIQIFFKTLLARYRAVRVLEAPLLWRRSLGYRGLTHLRVILYDDNLHAQRGYNDRRST